MFAVTDRLLLRPGWMEDAPALHQAIADEEIVRNLASAPWPYRLADAEAFLASEPKPQDVSLVIFRRTHGAPRLVGAIGFARKASGETELGYWIARPYWGLGFATEAGHAIVAMAQNSLRVDTLTAGHFVDNPASGRVLHKLGFRPTGTIAMRYSAGRGAAAPSRLFELRLREETEDPVAIAA
ncbi:GNAT family N-acetyltransferase [Sphingosinicella rhizophila]|uniref:GNAT family protein n=1 Tax=Sphingosinicella rhizophila TaxID=3050082 RepID=A0ABU3Q6N0_9SPHN|nr:GNAT family protein [Sphingosinicella sp. GR2756]MDT9598585.1 GNAT family protein [Sphingosinicella sp. GR2756]